MRKQLKKNKNGLKEQFNQLETALGELDEISTQLSKNIRSVALMENLWINSKPDILLTNLLPSKVTN